MTSLTAVNRPSVRAVVMPIAILVLYFVIPVDAERAPVGVLLGIALSVAALVGVVAVIVAEARGAHRLVGRHFVLALELAVVVFAFAYYVIATNEAEQFAGLGTRVDALYFSTATAATVGYGDVHPIGQPARALVTLHMLFNLVFIAGVVNLVRDRMSERRAALYRAGSDRSDEVG
ncbi:MAG: potassium channel family protein [Dermatophilaceae bacterium]